MYMYKQFTFSSIKICQHTSSLAHKDLFYCNCNFLALPVIN